MPWAWQGIRAACKATQPYSKQGGDVQGEYLAPLQSRGQDMALVQCLRLALPLG